MKKSLHYLTFQNFPMFSANTIVSMKTISYFKKSGLDVSLVFPGRDKVKSDKNRILDFYNIKEEINIVRTSYFLPFGKINFLNKFSFIFSHFMWSLIIYIKYLLSEKNLSDILFYTRSNWIFYFFSRKNLTIIYECHKYSKSTNIVFKLLKNKKNSGYIFQNSQLFENFELSDTQIENTVVCHSAYDEEDFKDLNNSKNEKDIIFIGRFSRFNEDRNLKFLIEAFGNQELREYKLKIVGGPVKFADKLREEVHKSNIPNVEILDYTPQDKLMKLLSSHSVGILINSSNDMHSKLHTSPVKYFEYIRSGLRVLAIDFKAHRALPYSDLIYFFKEGDSLEFIQRLKEASNNKDVIYKNIEQYSYHERIKQINKLFARLEGLEPPTL
jgi:glycosyltransferase involved in cell wall biosynthesis